jgi:hypothetical protein
MDVAAEKHALTTTAHKEFDMAHSQLVRHGMICVALRQGYNRELFFV